MGPTSEQPFRADQDRLGRLIEDGRRRLARGEPATAEGCFRQACHLDPGNISAWIGLGNAVLQQRRAGEACDAFRRALQIAPNSLIACTNLSKALRWSGNSTEAIRVLEQGLAHSPATATALINLGLAYEQQGLMDQAVDRYRRGLALAPANARIHSMLLYALTMHSHASPEQTFREHVAYGRVFGGHAGNVTHPNGRQRDRPLRIGYVSADFWQHAVSCFIEPVLRHHDPAAFTIFCYANVGTGDATTARLRELPLQWRSILGMSDDDVLRLIREDAIDILIDLSGHTGGNRLPVFARRAAPVQVSWIGYPNTTGLKEIDYRLVNGFTPPEQDRLYTERLFRLPTSAVCYDRHAAAPPPAPLPALHNGYVTFGSFNAIKKLNDDVVRVWSDVLRAIADSRLLVKAPGTREPEVRTRLQEQFAACGVVQERLTFEEASPAPKHLERYAAVDILLDPFPYTGGTTTRDSLWMGVPVLTLYGVRNSHRMSADLLMGLGLQDWIAYTPEEYVMRAAAAAAGLQELAALRAGLRERLRATSAFNPQRFTPELEQAFRTMWAAWCDGQDETSSANSSAAG